MKLAVALSFILILSSLAAAAPSQRDAASRDQSRASKEKNNTSKRGSRADSSRTASNNVQEAQEQASKAAKVFQEIMDIPENSIPQAIVNRAECIAVFPSVIKGGFLLFGGRWGRGVVSCRNAGSGAWGPPIFLEVKGGSFGPQIGGEAVDLILVGMNRSTADLFVKDRFKIGAEASAAAGPVGRTASAETDLPTIKTQFLSYSRSRGLFAGLELKGSVIGREKDLNRAVYGGDKDAGQILLNGVSVPSGIQVFQQTLSKYTPRRAK